MQLKLGRLKRTFQNIPHLSALLAARKNLPPAPVKVDWTKGMPIDLGIMKNNEIGDCTCAAFYHARQVWSHNAGGTIITEPDTDVLQLYEEACDYDPNNPDSDRGGVEQDVLAYLYKTGAPIGQTGLLRDKILAYFEVDVRNLDDLKRTIADCGVAYIGIEVPQSVMDNADDLSKPWMHSNNDKILGGHAVILVGYDLDYFYCISWGRKYKISHNFLVYYLEEAYAIIASEWVRSTGKTPLGMTVIQLQAQMHEMWYKP